jgi:hypothetical protein
MQAQGIGHPLAPRMETISVRLRAGEVEQMDRIAMASGMKRGTVARLLMQAAIGSESTLARLQSTGAIRVGQSAEVRP